mmetsp:Transcript_1106/g.2337  ORF Transcript_1106/g.2337 Transcript_1106/m.2337 type:complete len:218 (+) Transcript_1106:347-1000(+)
MERFPLGLRKPPAFLPKEEPPPAADHRSRVRRVSDGGNPAPEEHPRRNGPEAGSIGRDKPTAPDEIPQLGSLEQKNHERSKEDDGDQPSDEAKVDGDGGGAAESKGHGQGPHPGTPVQRERRLRIRSQLGGAADEAGLPRPGKQAGFDQFQQDIRMRAEYLCRSQEKVLRQPPSLVHRCPDALWSVPGELHLVHRQPVVEAPGNGSREQLVELLREA